MPNPKVGTVTMEVGQTVQDLKGGKVEYRVDKVGNIHVPVGKASFSEQQLLENTSSLIEGLVRAKPASARGPTSKACASPPPWDPACGWTQRRSSAVESCFSNSGCLVTTGERIIMERHEKEQAVADLHGVFQGVQTAVIAEYKGLSVAELDALRRELREVGGRYRVAKNSLVSLAVEGTPYLSLRDLLTGQNGLVLGYGEAVDLAKAVTRYAKDHEKLTIKGGVSEGQFLDASQLEALASLPSRDALRAQLLGLLSQPATRLAGVLAAPASQLARVLNARHEQADAQATPPTSANGLDV